MTTTVLALTLTGLAADPPEVSKPNSHTDRRLAAVGYMLAGAVAGALVVQHASTGWLHRSADVGGCGHRFAATALTKAVVMGSGSDPGVDAVPSRRRPDRLGNRDFARTPVRRATRQ